ncbi:MAG: XRE family transcriptional regulator [Bacteroidia bacterium]
MRKPVIKLSVIKEETGYSAFAKVGNNFIATQGESYNELKSNALEAVNLTFEENGFKYHAGEIAYELDLESFFNYYKVINTKALSEWVGISESNLAEYINGKKKPTPNQKQRIFKAIEKIGNELSQVRMLM